MFRLRILAVAATMLAALPSRAAVSFTENFSSNPFTAWTFGIGGTDPSANRFVWDSAAPAAYTGDAVGSLKVHLDSSLPTVRFQRPLGVTLTDTNDFTLITRFSFTIISAPTNQSMQIAFGLVNSALTGGNRTGTDGIYIDDDVFHTVEFNYFPQISTFSSPPTGPTLTPAVFGAKTNATADAFSNFAGYFFSEADLADNTTGIKELPAAATLQVTLAYSGAAKTLTLTLHQVNPDGSLILLNTELPPMSLASLPLIANYNTNFPFTVNSLAIMAYHDGFTTAGDPSLVADLTFQKLSFVTSVIEPSGASIKIVSTNAVLTFLTTSNCLYDVQSRTDLTTGSWSTISSNIVGTGGIVTNIDVGAASAPRRFYRVGLVLP